MTGRAFPVLPTLRGYRGAWLTADVTAGLTLVAIAIPEQMATAHLANMPAVVGLYAFVAGSLMFALLGRHPQMSVGADSTIAPVFAAGVATVAVAGSPEYDHLVSAVALVVGGFLVAVGVLRLGWVADFFPLPVVSGVLAGIGVEILVKQLPTVLGLPGGGTTTIGRLHEVADQLGKFNGWSLAIAIGVLAVLIGAERVDHRIPGALFGVVGATVVVAVADLARRGVKVLGPVHASLPHLGFPSAHLSQLGRLIGTAVTVAFLCVVQTSATVRSSSAPPAPARGPNPEGANPGRAKDKPGQGRPDEDDPFDFDVDLLAVGAGSLLAGLSGSFAIDASPPRTTVVGAAGGRSQVTSLVAVAAIVVVLALATSLLKDLPEAALGAILVFVASRLFRVKELRSILRFSWFEFALALITLLVVVLVGIEQGVVAAALLALAQRVRLAARPLETVLGREPGTDHWIPVDIGRPTEQVPGVVVYMLYAPLWYGNATHVVGSIYRELQEAGAPVHTLVLDANGVSDIDYTGAKALGEMIANLARQGVSICLARASHLVHHDLKQAGLLGTIGTDRLFASVDEAVRTCATSSAPAAPPPGPPS